MQISHTTQSLTICVWYNTPKPCLISEHLNSDELIIKGIPKRPGTRRGQRPFPSGCPIFEPGSWWIHSHIHSLSAYGQLTVSSRSAHGQGKHYFYSNASLHTTANALTALKSTWVAFERIFYPEVMLKEPNLIGLNFGTCLNRSERCWSAERDFSANTLHKWPVASLLWAKHEPIP